MVCEIWTENIESLFILQYHSVAHENSDFYVCGTLLYVLQPSDIFTQLTDFPTSYFIR